MAALCSCSPSHWDTCCSPIRCKHGRVSPGAVSHGRRGNDRCAAASTGPSSTCQGHRAAPTASRCSHHCASAHHPSRGQDNGKLLPDFAVVTTTLTDGTRVLAAGAAGSSWKSILRATCSSFLRPGPPIPRLASLGDTTRFDVRAAPGPHLVARLHRAELQARRGGRRSPAPSPTAPTPGRNWAEAHQTPSSFCSTTWGT
jgi:hypothetical protein